MGTVFFTCCIVSFFHIGMNENLLYHGPQVLHLVHAQNLSVCTLFTTWAVGC